MSNPEETAIALFERALDARAHGDLESAENLLGESVAIFLSVDGETSPDAANLLNVLAAIREERGNYASALATVEQAAQILNALGDQFAGSEAALVRHETYSRLGNLHRQRAEGAMLLPLLSLTQPRAAAGIQTSAWRAAREGFATVLESPWLWLSIVVFSLSNVALAGPYSVAMPFLVSENLKAGIETLGLLYAVFPLGYIVAGVWLGRYRRFRHRGPLIFGGIALAAIALGLFGLQPPIWVLLVAALVNGAALELGHLAWTYALQELVPNERLGRVASIDNMGSFALMPVGFALAGWATASFGAPLVFVVGGAFTALVAALGLAVPAIRHLD